MSQVNVPLDVYGQNPRLSGLYTQLCFCFSLPESQASIADTTEYLRKGLERLAIHFPWTAGQVVRTEDGTYTIVAYEKYPQLLTQDKRDDLPSFESYRDAGFPFRWLDEKNIASCNTLPDGGDGIAPVMSLKANFVRGGLLLVVSAQHNCMDMAGQSEVIRLFAKACDNTACFTDEELRIGNFPREHAIPLLENMPDDSKGMREETSDTGASKLREQPGSTKIKVIWSYFVFPAAALATIKSNAEKDKYTDFVSTDDTLSAFIWKHLTGSRLKSSPGMPRSSTFERQVDVRKQLNLPAKYPGNAVYKTSTTFSTEEVVSKPLGFLASELRASISPVPDIGYRARQDATLLHRRLQEESISSRAVTQGSIPPLDIKMSSWAKEDCCNFDFGSSLGRPEVVRRPSFEGWTGLAYLMPKGRHGEIAAALCLNEADTKALIANVDFARFSQYIG